MVNGRSSPSPFLPSVPLFHRRWTFSTACSPSTPAAASPSRTPSPTRACSKQSTKEPKPRNVTHTHKKKERRRKDNVCAHAWALVPVLGARRKLRRRPGALACPLFLIVLPTCVTSPGCVFVLVRYLSQLHLPDDEPLAGFKFDSTYEQSTGLDRSMLQVPNQRKIYSRSENRRKHAPCQRTDANMLQVREPTRAALHRRRCYRTGAWDDTGRGDGCACHTCMGKRPRAP